MSTARASSSDDGARASTRTCVGLTTFDDARESRRAVPTCYGLSRRADAALSETRRTLLTGDVVGRYRYACLGRSARAVPFYREGRRAPTLEERKRGTEFPVCQGLEMLVAERVDERALRRRDGDASEDDATDADGSKGARDGARRGGGTRERERGASAALERFNRSAGKITANMRRHAKFIGDGAYSLFFAGGRRS